MNVPKLFYFSAQMTIAWLNLLLQNVGLHYLNRAHTLELGTSLKVLPSESEITKNHWKQLAIYKEICSWVIVWICFRNKTKVLSKCVTQCKTSLFLYPSWWVDTGSLKHSPEGPACLGPRAVLFVMIIGIGSGDIHASYLWCFQIVSIDSLRSCFYVFIYLF